MAEGMMGLDASDVALLSRHNDDGWGNGMGFMWIFALLILANGGLGGWGNNGFANAIGYENLATSNEVQRGFDNQNSMANQREILGTVNTLAMQGQQNSNQNTQYLMGMFTDKYQEIQRDLGNLAMGQQQSIANQQKCCCDIERAIDGVNYNNAMNTASIEKTVVAEVQGLKDMITGNEMQRLREEKQMLAFGNMLNPIENRLSMVPTYPNTFAYNAGANPFCPGYGCGCNMAA